MNEIEALITVARRYCIENHEYWTNEYADKRNGSDSPVYSYSNSDYNIFPRYNALSAILSGVEYIVGSKFDNVEECKQKLIYLGENTDSIFTEGEKSNIEKGVIQEERNKFCEFIESIEIDDLWKIPSLSYRRRLRDEERNKIRQKLEDKWGFDGGCWFPLVDINSSLPVIFVLKDHMKKEDFARIEEFIGKIAEKYLFEITENQIDYEIETNSLDMDCYETIVCDVSFGWVVYGSHENTITFGGKNLVKYVKHVFDGRSKILNKFPQYN